MHIIERWGSGIPRVFEDARMYGLGDPEIKDFGTSFRISLHRKPFETDSFGVVIPSKDAKNDVQHQMRLNMMPKRQVLHHLMLKTR